MKTTYFFLCAILLSAIAFTSCHKEDDDNLLGGIIYGTDRGYTLKILNNTNAPFTVRYGAGDRSNQYHNNNITINPGKTGELYWEASDNHWWQHLHFYNQSNQQIALLDLSGRDEDGFNNSKHLNLIEPSLEGEESFHTWNIICFKENKLDWQAYAMTQVNGDYWGWKNQSAIEVRDAWIRPARERWMTGLPGNKRIGELSIPGCHDAGAYKYDGGFGTSADWVECQSKPFIGLMEWGARAFDLRVGDNMRIFHNHAGFEQNFEDFMKAANAFLAQNPGEFLIAFVKEEGDASQSPAKWIANMRTILNKYPDRLFLKKGELLTTPVDQLRGKIAFVTRWHYAHHRGYIEGAPQIKFIDDTQTQLTDRLPIEDENKNIIDYTIQVALEDNYGKERKSRAEHACNFWKTATPDWSDKWFISHTSGYKISSSTITPAPGLTAFYVNRAIWRNMLFGKGNLFSNDPFSVEIPRDGKLGTVMMDFVGEHATNSLRDDMIRRSYGK